MAEKKVASKKSVGTGVKVGIGIGLTTAAVAAVGAYFLVGSKNAAQNRKKVKGWTLKAKGEILEALEKAQEITAEEYSDLVEKAVGVYGTVKEVSKGEIKDFKNEMIEHWKKLEKNKAVRKLVKKNEVTGVKKNTKKATKNVVKKGA